MAATDLTVAAVVEFEGKFLTIEEYAAGRRVLTQPGGHIDAGESPEEAVERETLEESGCRVSCADLIGVYLWAHPQSGQQYLRLAYRASYIDVDESLALDEGVICRRWLTFNQLKSRRAMLRSPSVLLCVRDYVDGRLRSAAFMKKLPPIERNIAKVVAAAQQL